MRPQEPSLPYEAAVFCQTRGLSLCMKKFGVARIKHDSEQGRKWARDTDADRR
jgi:hypothetical protein